MEIIAAAAAQHLTAAGYRTLLAERGDYASGTSSRTSRLQHCGLSYFSPASNSMAAFLLNPRFALKSLELTRRAMRGRAEFVKTSPERVRPITSSGAAHTRKCDPSTAKAEAGLQDDAAVRPRLHPTGSSGAVAGRGATDSQSSGSGRAEGRDPRRDQFHPYTYLWPERIVIDTIMKARDAGCEALNYTPVVSIARDGEGWRVTLATADGHREVRTRAVVNCAGVWVDEVTALTGANGARLNSRRQGHQHRAAPARAV